MDRWGCLGGQNHKQEETRHMVAPPSTSWVRSATSINPIL